MKKVLSILACLVISLVGLVFCACDDVYQNVSLGASEENISLAVGETKTFSVEIKNMPSGMSNQLQVNNLNDIVQVAELEPNGNKVSIKLKGLKVGTASAEILSFEGDKSCRVNIEVYEKISTFGVNGSPFIEKSENFELNLSSSTFLKFSPQNAKKANVIYTYNYNNEDVEISKIVTIKDSTLLSVVILTKNNVQIIPPQDEFFLKASLEGYDFAPLEFKVKVISPIQTDKILMIKKGLSSLNYLTETIEIIDGEEISLIGNLAESSYTEFEVQCETPNVSFKIESGITESVPINIDSAKYTKTSEQSKFFSVQTRDFGKGDIKIKLYYSDFPDYVVTKTIKVNVVSTPSSVNVNGHTFDDASPVLLYNYKSSDASSFAMKINVLDKDAIFDSVQFSVLANKDDDASVIENFGNFLIVSYNGYKTSTFEITYGNFANNSLLGNILISGGETVHEKFYIKLTVKTAVGDTRATTIVPMEVKKGAKSIVLDEKYSGGVCLDINSGEQIFSGLSTDGDGYIGKISFEFLGNSENLFNISQVRENSLDLKLKAIASGSGQVLIILPNGISYTLNVIVEQSITSAKLTYLQSEIISKISNDSSENVTSLVVKYEKPVKDEDKVTLYLKLIEYFEGNTISNATMYYAEGNCSTENFSFDAKNLLVTVNSVGKAELTLTLNLQKIVDFQKESDEDNKLVFTISLEAYSPIKSITFMQGGKAINSVSLFALKDIGYKYYKDGMATSIVNVEVLRADGKTEVTNIFDGLSATVSFDNIIAPFTGVEGELKKFGSFFLSGNTITLKCTQLDVETGKSFAFGIILKEYNQTFAKTFNVNVKKYNKANWIGLQNYEDTVILSGTNVKHTFTVLLDPISDCKEFMCVFEPDLNVDPSLFSVNIISGTNEVEVTYANSAISGGGTLRFIPYTSITKEQTEDTPIYYDDKTLTVRIQYNDGKSSDKPELISTADEFLNAMKNNKTKKYYLITTTLDFSNKNISGLGSLISSIAGINSSSKLINLNIDNNSIKNNTTNSYAGLFSTIESTGEISNLSFEGSINLQNSDITYANNNYYIGLIAGINNGTLKNVSVNLQSSQVTLNNNKTDSTSLIALGGLVGQNNGQIITNVNTNNNSFNHCLINNQNLFTAKYNGYSSNVFFGGVAGENTGVIDKNIINNSVLYNSNVYSAKLNLSAEGFSGTGGIAGNNAFYLRAFDGYTNSLIQGQVVNGNIVSSLNEKDMGGKNVGGIVGIGNSFINNCKSKAYLTGYDYVGGILGKDNVSSSQNAITNCKVDAPKTNSFVPLILGKSTDCNLGAISGNEKSGLVNGYKVSNTASYYYASSEKVFPVICKPTDSPSAFDSGMFIQKSASINIIDIAEVADSQELIFASDETLYANSVVNMFYYEATNSSEQKYIDYKNQNKTIPFVFENSDTISLFSLNLNVLKINENGTFTITGTGLAKLQVKTILDETLLNKFIYVNVVNAFDSFLLEISEDEQLPYTLPEVNVREENPATLQYRYAHSNIEMYNENHYPISVKLKDSSAGKIAYLFDNGEIKTRYSALTVAGNKIIISAHSITDLVQVHSNSVKINPEYVVSLENLGDFKITNLAPILTEAIGEYDLKINVKQGTTKLVTNYSSITAEPSDEIELFVTQTTDLSSDYITVTSVKVGDSEFGAKDYFNILYTTNYTQDVNISNKFYVDIDGSGLTNFDGNFTLQFNFAKYGTTNYAGEYFINIVTENGIRTSVLVTLKTQSLRSLTLKNYYNLETDINGNNLFDIKTDLQSSYMASGAKNLLIVEVFPVFADFDYIYVLNDQTNYAKNNIIIMEVKKYNLSTNTFSKLTQNINYTDKGVMIYKNALLEDGKLLSKIYITYETISRATVDTFAKINVEVFKSEEIIFSASKTLSVIVRDSVFFTIVGKDMSRSVYVARGMSYNMSLSVYGFTQDQVKWEIENKSTDTRNVVTITQENGAYKLNINKTIVYEAGKEGFEVEIRTYAKNTANGQDYQSGVSIINLMIVDFVVLMDNLETYDITENNLNNFSNYTIIKSAEKAVAEIAVGNKFTLETNFVNGNTIEYDSSNLDVVEKVKNFTNSLNANSTWRINASELGVIDNFRKQIELNSSTIPFDNTYMIFDNTTGSLDITPLKTVDRLTPTYYFSFATSFVYQSGLAVYSADISSYNYHTDFVLEVYQNSTLENAIPVYNYADLMAMKAGSHYILLNDVILENNFTPLTTAVASLDGNGHTITYPNSLTLASGTEFGLFGTVSADTTLKNITIKINRTTNVIISSTNSIYFGLIAGVNNGIITNCEVSSKDFVQFSVSMPNQTTDLENNYVAGLVGNNNGFITNSRVSMTLSAVANVSGFVGINNNKIASSYVKQSMIINKSSSALHKTAGFAIKNGITTISKALITTSYVTGDVSTGKIYSDSTKYCISSATSVSGFVYSNFSDINNCYSDILINSSSNCAGFVFENAGLLSSTYTTSTFGTSGQEVDSYLNTITEDGRVENSFYLYRSDARAIDLSGLTPLFDADFKDASYFAGFGLSGVIDKTEGVWFYPLETSESAFTKNGVSMKFTYNKPELVSPNIITSSQKILDTKNTKVNQSGETNYVYIETLSPSGSQYNPILVSSSAEFELLMKEGAYRNINSKDYRIIADLDYIADNVNICSTYGITIIGKIEGNGMNIQNFSIDYRQSTKSGGLFAQIGQGYSNTGVVKNLTLTPKYINLPNATTAGTLAGALEGGRIYNIKADGFTSDANGVQILGNNIVGGVIGLATNSFKMINVSSSVKALASYDHTKSSSQFAFYNGNSNNVSYAGGVAGALSNGGTVYNASVNNATFAIGEVVGLLFGKVGNNVNVSNINLELTERQAISAYSYGGIIAGENSGNISNVSISGAVQKDFFKAVDLKTAVAVGGAVGFMQGGSLTNVNIKLDFNFDIISPEIFGGLVGEITAGELNSCKFTGKLNLKADLSQYALSKVIVGGIVAKISFEPSIETSSKVYASNVTLTNCNTSGAINVVTLDLLEVCIGGIVGQIINTEKLTDDGGCTSKFTYTLLQAINNMNISLDSDVYEGIFSSYVGGLVGGVFSDASKIYAGEIIIHDTISNNSFASSSNSVISLKIEGKKSTATIHTYYGGILGRGYSSSKLTITSAPTSSSVFGQLLSSATKLSTSPNYTGKYDKDSNLITDFANSENLSLSVVGKHITHSN